MPKLSGAELFLFIVQILSLLGLSKLLGEVARKLKQPAVIGEILAGIILGPTILGTLFPGAFDWLFANSGGAGIALDGLISLSVVFLLFVVGLEIDLKGLAKQRKAVGIISGLGIIIPLIVGAIVGWLMFGLSNPPIERGLFALFMGAALSISALPVIAKVLLDLNLLKTHHSSSLIIGVATINDIVGWLLFTLVLSLSGHAAAHTSMAVTLVLTVALALSAVTWLQRFMNWLLEKVYGLFPNNGSVIGVTVFCMLLLSLFTEYIGIHAVFGAFIVGIAVNTSPRFNHEMRESIHSFTLNILAPLFFAAVGLKINFLEGFNLWIVLVVLVAAYFSKMLAGYFGAKLAKLPTNEGLAIGLGITARGGMGIILAIIALDTHLINAQIFEALVIMAIVTSISAGFIKYVIQPTAPEKI
jgi:Kef-type K+ transport system membrane component KefB